MNPVAIFDALEALSASVGRIGRVYEIALIVVAAVVALVAWLPPLARWRDWALGGLTFVLFAGEGILIWFHWRIYQLAEVVSPDGVASGRVAVPLWVESEKLFVWALLVAVLGLIVARQRDELMPGIMTAAALLCVGASVLGKPFTEPLPSFFGQYYGYLQGMYQGGQIASQAYNGMEGSRQYFYNAWYMWVHPPMLFLAYGAFVISFVATLKMIVHRHSSYETTAYRWARFGYIWLTLGILLGFPWALSAWTGESWWWSGKVNMSLMMWLLYTAYLHARLYLRTRGMWKTVAVLAVLSFIILVLTYVATYVVPGAHSYATLAHDSSVALAFVAQGVTS